MTVSLFKCSDQIQRLFPGSPGCATLPLMRVYAGAHFPIAGLGGRDVEGARRQTQNEPFRNRAFARAGATSDKYRLPHTRVTEQNR